jgi:hypothetical protein
LDKFNLILESSSFNIENVLVVVGGFSSKEEAVAALGDNLVKHR